MSLQYTIWGIDESNSFALKQTKQHKHDKKARY